MPGLTFKQETFCQGIASGLTQSDAYRAAYATKKWKNETVWEKASVLISKDKVKARIAELRAPVVKKVGITLENHIEDLLKLRNMAAKKEQYSAAIKAEMARGKVCGLYEFEQTPEENVPMPTKIEIQVVDGRKQD